MVYRVYRHHCDGDYCRMVSEHADPDEARAECARLNQEQREDRASPWHYTHDADDARKEATP